MAWDWQVFCRNTTEGTIEPTCWAKGADITYLEWMIHSWGWTLSVAACAWVVAVIVGALVGTARTLPNSPWLVRLANAWVEAAPAASLWRNQIIAAHRTVQRDVIVNEKEMLVCPSQQRQF